MRSKLLVIMVLISLGVYYAIHQIITDHNEIYNYSAKISEEYTPLTLSEKNEYLRLQQQALTIAKLYNEFIKEDHLYHGMVVNKAIDGTFLGECDSLLFSSLRFVALKKLSWDDEAQRAWRSIQNVNENGRWYRHPKCRRRWTSRDMIVGVLAALLQKPPSYKRHIKELITYVGDNSGYIGSGPFYVSLMSPGLGEILRVLSSQAGIEEEDLPSKIRYSFSTIEFDAIAGRRGYTAHLNALSLWIEQELINESNRKTRSISEFLDQLMGSLNNYSFEKKRMLWIASKLVELDSKNMFFRWLQLFAANQINERVRYNFLKELLSMPQFPHDRLPQNCDRKADYLWQRDSRELFPEGINIECIETYNGVDFLWMLSLILDDINISETR